ncbi:AraC family transcriptional regulator [Segatella copri]|uniref:AraC family transcriptional regulator n=1 Tax=Segatella copri TaxID=165179 RepID=UPI0025CFEF6C|nr:helix-turn-helix domain-containing protein [Segatella copri]MDV3106897.1 AraC family ligand binding domain-containing protein [Segatella copri]MDV3113473.1 AraC family ligand binding domain-containing protein [Segatella copri]WOF88641.1 AraC family ligand binding domain-containing protein [Segatella copri]WOF94789.1 AraC family ligand binding domain-containing protein [Segatella copri]WOG33020.1 AraC family ligand binding domain-containing protein [Segatella copri]
MEMNNLKIKDGFKGERSLIMPEMILNLAKEDPVLRNLHITDIGYYPHATYHYRERTEPIDQCVLIYCVKGSGKYSINGKQYEVKANQYFILPAMTPHAYASNNNDPWTIYWIHFRGNLADYYAEGAEKPITVSPNLSSRIADRNNIFEDIFLTLSDGYTIENLRYTASMLHFYLGSLRYLPLYRKYHKKEQQNDKEIDTVINASLKFMEENIERQVTLQDISQYTGYSISHFSAIFKSHTGHSPLSYFNQLKIKKACELLDTTDMKINQISYKIGIDDSYYFSRLFTKTVGISPKKYREKNMTANTEQ